MAAEALVEVWRGPFCESLHRGHAVVFDAGGDIVASWGDPDQVILPRSSVKMIQALPLIESGAADAFGLNQAQLALSCASHNGAAVHSEMVQSWLSDLELDQHDLRCGSQMPDDREARNALIRAAEEPCQMHNNCSGKHSGFLTLNKHLGGEAEYVDPDHPVQIAVKQAFEEVTGEDSPGFGIDGCSAPNFSCSVTGLARAMSGFAASGGKSGARAEAMSALWQAMASHPVLVAGEGRACTDLMRAMGGRVAVKTGAEAVFTAIVPERGMGVTLKIEDGATRASEAAIAGILCGLGVLEREHPVAKRLMHGPIHNRRQIETGNLRLSDSIGSWVA